MIAAVATIGAFAFFIWLIAYKVAYIRELFDIMRPRASDTTRRITIPGEDNDRSGESG